MNAWREGQPVKLRANAEGPEEEGVVVGASGSDTYIVRVGEAYRDPDVAHDDGLREVGADQLEARVLDPGLRVVDGEVMYSAAWLGDPGVRPAAPAAPSWREYVAGLTHAELRAEHARCAASGALGDGYFRALCDEQDRRDY